MKFILSDEMKIDLLPEQEAELCTKETIKKNAKRRNVLTFDIYDGELLIGFAQLRKYKRKCYFLWNFAIDQKYQNNHYGTRALEELIEFMKNEYDVKEIVTTYLFGNEHAKHVYEKVGFIETDVVDEDGCHEVNMIIKIK